VTLPQFSDELKIRLQTIVDRAPVSQVGKRIQILLLTSAGESIESIAALLGLDVHLVSCWVDAYHMEGARILYRFRYHLAQEDRNARGSLLERTKHMDMPVAVSVASLQDSHAAGRTKAKFVSQIALALFDQTTSLHGLNERHRQLLEAAAELHQLKRKPKASQAEILTQPLEGFSTQEQEMIAALVLYQRRDGLHDWLVQSSLSDEEQAAMRALLALLRLAIGLDSSNTQTTRLEAVQIQPDGLHLRADGPQALADVIATQSFASFWSEVFGQNVHLSGAAGIDLEQVTQLAGSLSGPGVSPDDTMSEAGRKILRYHFLQMLVHEPGTRAGEDIEELHDMRVASRRMRAAFDVFGEYFKKKAIRTHLKGLRATGRALGHVRDLDVFLEKAAYFLDQAPEDERRGLDPLLALWVAEREVARTQMISHLDSVAYQTFVQRFNLFLNTTGEGARQFDSDQPTPHRVRDVAPMMIYTRLAAVRAYEAILDNASYDQLHALRIDFKYLRYTLEFFREVLGPESKAVIEDIKQVQDHLGDLNDADVACGILQDFLANWEQRQLALPLNERQSSEPVVRYLAAKHAERYQLLVTFPQAWAHLVRLEFRSNLAQAVSVL
jgi:CHAD domain-containing protein